MSEKSPLKNVPFGPPKFSRFDTLPAKIQNKIERDKITGCWIWTAYASPGRTRPRAYRSPENFDGFRHKSHYIGNERPTPIVQDPFKKKLRPANRVVYGILTGSYVDDVPRLERCRNPLCVNPKHMSPIGPSPNRGQSEERPTFEAVGIKAKPGPEAVTVVDVLAVLKERSPSTSLQAPDDFPSIEEDYGLPTGSLTMPIWVKYVQWDMKENPDDYKENLDDY